MNLKEEFKKSKELRYLSFFRETELGRNFFDDLIFVDSHKEIPDFLFISCSGPICQDTKSLFIKIGF